MPLKREEAPQQDRRASASPQEASVPGKASLVGAGYDGGSRPPRYSQPPPIGHAIQFSAPGDPSVAQRAAAHGAEGAGHELPFFGQIQASFGPDHDLSGVQAHTDSAAAEGSAAMGAQAFATGDHVAFGGAPDVHTAAHEAAHVVQQAHGVNLYGGVGQAGDDYERHADAVADRVVAGESAVDLLGAAAGSSAPTGCVQRQAAGGGNAAAAPSATTPSVPTTAEQVMHPDIKHDDISQGATGQIVISKIKDYIDHHVFDFLVSATEEACGELSEVPEPPEPSIAQKIVQAVAEMSISLISGTVGEQFGRALKHWAGEAAIGEQLVPSLINKSISTVSETVGSAPKALIGMVTPKQEGQPASKKHEQFLLLQHFRQGMIDSLHAWQTHVDTGLDDLVAMADSIPAATRTSLARDVQGMEVTALQAQQRQQTMLSWMNLNAALSIPAHKGTTVMPEANQLGGGDTGAQIVWGGLLDGFIDIYVELPDPIAGVSGAELGRLVVLSHKNVVDMLRDAAMPLDQVNVNRRVWLGPGGLYKEPAFVMNAAGGLELRSWLSPFLIAVGSGKEISQPKAIETYSGTQQSLLDVAHGAPVDGDLAQQMAHIGAMVDNQRLATNGMYMLLTLLRHWTTEDAEELS